MNKPKDYDNTQAAGEYKVLPPGGYVCKIVKVLETESQSGKPMLHIGLDIAEGEYTGFFQDRYNKDTRSYKKWPSIFYQLIYTSDGKTNRMFKAFCESVEHSNNINMPWGDNFATDLRGKLVGVLYGREEYVGQDDGMSHWTVKPRFWRSAESIRKGDFTVPEDRPVKKSDSQTSMPEGFDSISDDDIPF